MIILYSIALLNSPLTSSRLFGRFLEIYLNHYVTYKIYNIIYSILSCYDFYSFCPSFHWLDLPDLCWIALVRVSIFALYTISRTSFHLWPIRGHFGCIQFWAITQAAVMKRYMMFCVDISWAILTTQEDKRGVVC